MIESQIELRHLRYFVALAEHRHFTRAAQAANISQPTLSQQIRQLEHVFGGPLVDRIGKQVSLTAAGEALLPHARSVLKLIGEAREAVDQTRGLTVGEVRLAVVQTVNATLVPNLLAQFAGAYPGISVSSREVSSDELEAGLLSSHFDLGVGFFPATRPGLTAEPLFDEELVVIAPKTHPLIREAKVKVHQLGEYPLALLPRGYCTRELLQSAFARSGTAPRPALELNSIDGLLSTAQQTGLATVLPAFAFHKKLPADLRTRPLVSPALQRTVAIVWRAGAFRTAAANALAALTSQVVAQYLQTRYKVSKRRPSPPTQPQHGR